MLCSFWEKIAKIIRLYPHLWDWCPLTEILDPPLMWFKSNFTWVKSNFAWVRSTKVKFFTSYSAIHQAADGRNSKETFTSH